MEETISLIITGCKIAQELESSLRGLNSPAQLLEKCEQIAGAFTVASQLLRALHGQQERLLLAPVEAAEAAEEKIQADEAAAGGGPIVSVGPMPNSSKGKGVIMQAQQLPCGVSGRLVEEGGGDHLLPAYEVKGGADHRLPAYEVKGGGAGGSSGGEGSSSQKSRKRKDESGKTTIEVAAPLHGNTEIPPDDGYTWRKYGQKEILGALFPRGYYRCTHQKLYNCPAKKQVQRLNNNPRIFQVTYRGHHTCHMSFTAPAAAIPPLALPQLTTNAAHCDTTSFPGWLSIDLMSQPLITSTSTISMSSASTTPTAIFDPIFNREPTPLNAEVAQGRDHQGDHGATVADMADAMFNSSAGSGGDSIDSIFSK